MYLTDGETKLTDDQCHGIYWSTISDRSFGVVVKWNHTQITWHACRETFHEYSVCCGGLREIFFRHNDTSSLAVAKFMHAVETHLCLRERSVFRRTSKPSVTHVNASPWWLKCSARHQFFTICLRAGCEWRGGDWYSCLMDSYYVQKTVSATKRFLAGFTWCDEPIQGWVKKFSQRNEPQVSCHLVRDPEDRDNLIGHVAYRKWEAAGRPCGRDREFWLAAVVEYDAAA